MHPAVAAFRTDDGVAGPVLLFAEVSKVASPFVTYRYVQKANQYEKAP
jgi:hypothetical protein